MFWYAFLMYKINVENAYDSVDWIFLKPALSKFGIPPIIVDLMMSCTTIATLSPRWNNDQLDNFIHSWGVEAMGPRVSLFVLALHGEISVVYHLRETLVWEELDLSLWLCWETMCGILFRILISYRYNCLQGNLFINLTFFRLLKRDSYSGYYIVKATNKYSLFVIHYMCGKRWHIHLVWQMNSPWLCF